MPAGDFAVLAVLAVRNARQRYRAVCTPVWAFLQKVGKQADRETRADLGKRGRVVATNQNKIKKPRSFARVSKASKNHVSKTGFKMGVKRGFSADSSAAASRASGCPLGRIKAGRSPHPL